MKKKDHLMNVVEKTRKTEKRKKRGRGRARNGAKKAVVGL